MPLPHTDARFTGATELLSRAYAFAAEAHAGRRREADGSPYIEHSLAVGRLLYLAGCREEVVAAGLLHETVGHTRVRVEDIEHHFGREVSELVAATSEPAERSVTDAGDEAEAVVAADRVVSAQGDVPENPQVEHYRSTLGLVDDVAESLPLVPLLREELDQISARLRAR